MKVSAASYALPTDFTGIVVVSDSTGIPPTVTSVTPSHGDELDDTAVTIAGTGFTDARRVLVHSSATAGNVRDLIVVSDTEITCTIPSRYGNAPLVVNVYVDTPAGLGSLTNGWTWDHSETPTPPAILTETGHTLMSEDGDYLILEA